VRFRLCPPYSSIGNEWMDNLRPGGVLKWKVEDCQLERLGSLIWKVGTTKIVSPACVS
jgi:hypothetical protein